MTAKIYLPAVTDADPERDFILRGTIPLLKGTDDEHLACGQCKAVLARNVSTRTAYEQGKNSTGRMILRCECGRDSLVRIGVAE